MNTSSLRARAIYAAAHACTNIAIGTIESNDPWLMTNRSVQCVTYQVRQSSQAHKQRSIKNETYSKFR